jgi:hypothetical protein
LEQSFQELQKTTKGASKTNKAEEELVHRCQLDVKSLRAQCDRLESDMTHRILELTMRGRVGFQSSSCVNQVRTQSAGAVVVGASLRQSPSQEGFSAVDTKEPGSPDFGRDRSPSSPSRDRKLAFTPSFAALQGKRDKLAPRSSSGQTAQKCDLLLPSASLSALGSESDSCKSTGDLSNASVESEASTALANSVSSASVSDVSGRICTDESADNKKNRSLPLNLTGQATRVCDILSRSASFVPLGSKSVPSVPGKRRQSVGDLNMKSVGLYAGAALGGVASTSDVSGRVRTDSGVDGMKYLFSVRDLTEHTTRKRDHLFRSASMCPPSSESIACKRQSSRSGGSKALGSSASVPDVPGRSRAEIPVDGGVGRESDRKHSQGNGTCTHSCTELLARSAWQNSMRVAAVRASLTEDLK